MDSERQTTGKYLLDLTREVWPWCLLKFKGHIDNVEPGCLIELMLSDPDMIDSVDLIIRRTGGRIIRIEKNRDCYRILIQR